MTPKEKKKGKQYEHPFSFCVLFQFALLIFLSYVALTISFKRYFRAITVKLALYVGLSIGT